MARIVTFAEYGAPDVLKIEDIPLPEPGPDEIRIAVKAIGLNRAESMWRTGVYVEAVNHLKVLPVRTNRRSASRTGKEPAFRQDRRHSVICGSRL